MNSIGYRPVLCVNTAIVRSNISQMMSKLSESVRFRPHFKTHQNREVGRLYRNLGVTTITVSSFEMAEYFAEDGWDDITIAVPVNVHQLSAIRDLSKRVRLGIMVDSTESLSRLFKELGPDSVDLWLEIDTGYSRTGLHWENLEAISDCVRLVEDNGGLSRLKGLLAHAGHSYALRDRSEIKQLYLETVSRVDAIKEAIAQESWTPLVSVGDTPGCSIMDRFEGVDEVRPGNFVYYDLTQEQVGSCSQEQIAVAVAVPVIGVYPDRGEVVVYGGGVHFSKDVLTVDGQSVYGYLVSPDDQGWRSVSRVNKLIKLSQEHGTIQADLTFLSGISVGDILYVQPVHACMAADLLRGHTVVQ